MPYTANYEITLSAPQGAGNVAGGYGYELSKTIRLNYGDTIKVEIANQPGAYMSGSTMVLPGAQPSKMWINNELVWVAGGGSGNLSNVKAQSGVWGYSVQGGFGASGTPSTSSYSVHWHQGDSNAGAVYGTRYGYGNPGGCYRNAGHTHGVGNCEAHEKHEESRPHSGGSYPCPICGRNMTGYYQANGEWMLEGNTTWGCTGGHCDHIDNTWVINCGMSHGQILNAASFRPSPGNCYCKPGYEPSASLSRSGNGRFAIKLAEHSGLAYQNQTVRTGNYLNNRFNLVVLENTVVYYKRF